MNRRDFFLNTAAGMTLGRSVRASTRMTEPGVTDSEILIGQSAVLSGPVGMGVQMATAGYKLALEEANAKGGVAGRRLRFVALDDEFNPAKSKENFEALVKQHQVLACAMTIGAAPTLAGLPVLRENGVPVFGGVVEGDSVREKTQGVVYYTRASQQREFESLVQHIGILGIQRIAVVTLDNVGGGRRPWIRPRRKSAGAV